MNPNQPRKDDVILGGQTRVPFGAAVLGGLFGFKWRLANGSVEQRLAALSEALKYKEGYDLLTQQALKDNSEKVQHWDAPCICSHARQNNDPSNRRVDRWFTNRRVIDGLPIEEL